MAVQIISPNDINFLNALLIEAGNSAVSLQARFCADENIHSNAQAFPNIDEQISDLLVDALKNRFTRDTIISEEALPERFLLGNEFTWLIDPIDGTHHYMANDSQYSIMIGLLWAGKPVYGWVYNPAFGSLYHGGPGLGAWRVNSSGQNKLLDADLSLEDKHVRVILGRRDKKNNPWLDQLADIDLIEAGSIGYKLSRIIENEADVLIHLSGRLKVWDTAGPVALALGAGLEVGSRDLDQIIYPQDSFIHPLAIVMGKKGSLHWFRSKIMTL